MCISNASPKTHERFERRQKYADVHTNRMKQYTCM